MLYVISWLTDFALMLFVFAGTRALAEQQASPVLLGSLGASFFLACSLSNAWSGWLADRIGRRPVAITGSALLILSLGAVAGTSAESALFFVSYTAVGISVGHIYPPVMAWIGHNKSGSAARRSFLFFCLAFNLGMMSGQLSGGWIFERIGPSAPLQIAIGLTVLVLILLAAYRTEGASRPLPPKVASASSDGELARAFSRLHWIANFGGMFSMSLVWFLLPHLVVHLEIKPSIHGTLLGTGRAVVIAMYLLMYFRAGWQFRFEFAAVMQVVGASGLLVISTTESPAGLGIGIAGLSMLMGYNYFASLFYSARGNSADRKGSAFGLNEASLAFGAAGGSLIGGFVSVEYGSRSPFQTATALVVTLLVVQTILYFRFVRPMKQIGKSHNHPTAGQQASTIKTA